MPSAAGVYHRAQASSTVEHSELDAIEESDDVNVIQTTTFPLHTLEFLKCVYRQRCR